MGCPDLAVGGNRPPAAAGVEARGGSDAPFARQQQGDQKNELRELDALRGKTHRARRDNDNQEDDRPSGVAGTQKDFRKQADESDREQDSMNNAELDGCRRSRISMP